MQRTGQEPRKVRASGIEFDCVSLDQCSTSTGARLRKENSTKNLPQPQAFRDGEGNCVAPTIFDAARPGTPRTPSWTRPRISIGGGPRETLPGQSQNGTALTFCPQGPVLLGGVSTLHDACSPVTLVTRLPVTAVMYVRARNADNQWKCHKRHNESVGASVFKANPLKNQPFLMWWLAKPRSSRF